MIGWRVCADSEEIEEVTYNEFDVITKSKDLDFEKGVNLWLLIDILTQSSTL